ncbi:two-component system regulatory protein YycI [Enterococcus devriesei]|uniref:two-component system regulatory protein YycI n=1 Tax=Enterococcus TaxID=1350 RepID=UPI001C11CD99|nr:two-component system regulatory protein YycI [Enterococcus devriesei]MBU5364073.1 two-component system regulatory protein YycI [Enterococcus devriesei]MDT2820671.1 two-component system regulatory protein YycI [Enterococcus devriesei]
MDFRKIEWIFFFVFIGLNIFLFSIFWSNQHEQSLVTNSNQREDIIHRLKNDDIELNEKISDEHREGYYLSAEQDDFQALLSEPSNQTIAQTASVSDKILTDYPSQNREFDLKATQKSFNQLMQENTFIMDGQQYSYLPDISKKENELAKIVGAQSYEGIPFMDETSRVTLDVEKSDGEVQVLKYTQTRLKEIEPLREKMSLYSEKEILNTLYINNNIPAKSTITNVYLGYFRTLEVREKNVYVPVWFVKIRTADKTTQIEKVNALNNQVITNNLVPKVENP